MMVLIACDVAPVLESSFLLAIPRCLPPHPEPCHTLSHPRRTGKKADLLPTRSLPHPTPGAEEEEEGQSLARGPCPELRWASLTDTMGLTS